MNPGNRPSSPSPSGTPRRTRQLNRPPNTPEASPVKVVGNPTALVAALPRPAKGVKVLASGIDTLHLFAREPVRKDAAAKLSRLREIAQAEQKAGNPLAASLWTVAGHHFNVAPHGARTAPFLLDHKDTMAVLVNPDAAPGFPTYTAELRALHLWQLGADACALDAGEVGAELLDLSSFVNPDAATKIHPDLHVGRLDLAVDFEGWTPDPAEGFAPVADEGRIRYVTRCRSFAAHVESRRFTGFSWGRGDVVARLYDKTAEAAGSAKLRAMAKVWKKGGATGDLAKDEHGKVTSKWTGPPVWRLEFQLRRPALAGLTDAAGEPLSTWLRMRPTFRALWDYLATRWLARRAPRTKTSRQPVTPEWSAVAGAGFASGVWLGCTDDLHRARREELAERITPQLAGYLARALAEEWYFSPGRIPGSGEVPGFDLDGAWPAIRERVEAHARAKGSDLEERARDKLSTWDSAKLASLDRSNGEIVDEDEAAADELARVRSA